MLKHRTWAFSRMGRALRGFTLVELLVVIGIIAILAGVSLGPITNGLERAKESAGMQLARSINIMCFQFSTDYDNYPAGQKSEDIARLLLQNKYTSDPTVFALNPSHKYTGSQRDFSDFGPTNIDWDFTVVSATQGISSSSSDLLPVVYCTGENVTYPKSGPLNLMLSGSGYFKNFGIAVAYKGNNATFVRATLSGTMATANNFIPPSYGDSTTYVQIRP